MITTEEKLMYQVMKAIYDSGIPIDFKGSMVLKACLLEAGYNEEIRHTVDIDANWYSDNYPTAEQMTGSLQKALDRSNIDLQVSLYRMYGERCSAGFELSDSSGKVLFSMDIDVNRPVSSTKIYEIEGFHFRGVSPSQMIADKVSAISTDRIFYRIKDVIDLYYLSKAFDFDKSEIMRILDNNNRELGSFDGFLNRQNDLKHAYDKFRLTGDVNKPQFSEVYSDVKNYIKDILPKN
ncbi:MAG: nucleotidyl transferase AbiEii/AbiGii toxin family protein [Oscillospiraceae bacterium]|nr:nucleotidyl transferase AbiEii/AbiGii toxin family protein [Ruminococcus sp.]MCD8345258.1 nucleotidyl transferase AbiEii/AbiGii toxin family protein [Oscillospiraceae bacterium]